MPIGRVAALLATLSLCLVASGCGSESHATHTTAAAAPTSPPPPGAPPAAAPSGVAAQLARRVLGNGQLAGMVVAAGSMAIGDAASWAGGQNLSGAALTKEVDRLRRLGFVAALPENLTTKGNADRFGLSLVEQFSSSQSAKAELADATNRAGLSVKFPVSGIPGAIGFESTGGTGGGRNVAFADGRYYYLVGDGWNSSSKDAVPRDKLIAAALTLYRKVHSEPGG